MDLQPTVLIVDDEKHTRDGLRRLLENDHDVYVAADMAGATDVLEREQVDVLLTDLRLGSEDGMTLIDRALKMSRPPICIMMTAYGSVDVAVEAMKRGAYDFVTKPLNLDKVELLIARAVQSRKLEQENRALRELVDERYGLENIWGDSPALHDVLETIKQVAPSSANVLIEGESGTGKELAAHAIHNLSRRNKAKFVAVHCAALSPQLLESELFGHEKGAFTGANARSSGRFEQAEGGTLFLDEIGDMPMEAQTRLLRVLQQGEYTTVGGRTPIKANVRIIAATNKDLRILIQQGLFREDLFFRLNVVPLRLPPLRERSEDVPDLIRHFFDVVEREGLAHKQLDQDAMERLKRHRWPGNVRELENLARRLAALYPQETITSSVIDSELSLPGMFAADDELKSSDGLSSAVERHLASYFASFGGQLPPPGLYHRVLREIEHPLLSATLAATRGNQIRAADLLGVNRNTLRKKIRDLDIQVFRGAG
jgi:two-component system nitrogen regulation response regulator GlnG